MIKLSDELKQAIKRMPVAEKDKLLLRLIPKNEDLVRKLEFELLEGDTVELRRDEIKQEFLKYFKQYPGYFYSPGYLLMSLRDCSGIINRHVKATKDKVGEIELNLLMMTEALGRNETELHAAPIRKQQTLNDYVVKRTIKVMKLINKQHEDYRIEFCEKVEELGKLIQRHPIMSKVAASLGLDLDKLIYFC